MRSIRGVDFLLWMLMILGWFILEIRGLLNKNDWTFTAIVLRFVPPDVIAALLGWMVWHFLIKPTLAHWT